LALSIATSVPVPIAILSRANVASFIPSPAGNFPFCLQSLNFFGGLSSDKQPAIKDVKCNSSAGWLFFIISRKHNHLDTLTHQFFYGGYAVAFIASVIVTQPITVLSTEI
jgi:hypothetical protein